MRDVREPTCGQITTKGRSCRNAARSCTADHPRPQSGTSMQDGRTRATVAAAANADPLADVRGSGEIPDLMEALIQSLRDAGCIASDSPPDGQPVS